MKISLWFLVVAGSFVGNLTLTHATDLPVNCGAILTMGACVQKGCHWKPAADIAKAKADGLPLATCVKH